MNNREQSVPDQAVEKSNLEKEIQKEQINQTFLLSKILDKTLNRKRLIDTEKSAHQDINESYDSDVTADANSNQKGVLKKKRLQKEEMKRKSFEKRKSISMQKQRSAERENLEVQLFVLKIFVR